MRKFIKARRKKRFIKAVRTLRGEYERHKAANHLAEFVAVNQSMVMLRCEQCPNLNP